MVNYPPQTVFRSARAVPPPYQPPRIFGITCSISTQLLLAKALILLAGLTFLFSSFYLPILLQKDELMTGETLSQAEADIHKMSPFHMRKRPPLSVDPNLVKPMLNKDTSALKESFQNSIKSDKIPPLDTHLVGENISVQNQESSDLNVDIDSNTLDILEHHVPQQVEKQESSETKHTLQNTTLSMKQENQSVNRTNSNSIHSITLQDLQSQRPFMRPLSLGRGVSGLPDTMTPSLHGAQRGKIVCDVDVDHFAYWNDPVGDLDANYKSPFATSTETKYVTFENDSGGWNNIRMSLEIVAVFAAVTRRTLVLPPDMPLYLSNKADKKGKVQRSAGDFFPLMNDKIKTAGHLNVIRFEDFIALENIRTNYPYESDKEKDAVLAGANKCIMMKISDISCFGPYEYLRRIGYSIGEGKESLENEQVKHFDAILHCFIFDEKVFQQSDPSAVINLETARQLLDPKTMETMKAFCEKRTAIFYDQYIEKQPIFHFRTSESSSRMLNHFYSFLHFTDPSVGNHYNRFVRDFMHYNDDIYCAAGKIILALQAEARQANFGNSELDEEGGAGFSSFHIRRGDFQYPTVKISAQEWYNNSKELFPQKPNRTELIYIATDERNKTFFADLAKHYELRFLDDYWNLAKLGELDPNYMGMIDTIVSSRARVFVGTWFSTFTGYINRMRGYHGMTMRNSWYGTLDRKERMQTFSLPTGNYIAREWPVGWVGIDGNSIAVSERRINSN